MKLIRDLAKNALIFGHELYFGRQQGHKRGCWSGQVELVRRDYVGSEGWETFLSYEDPSQDILVGLLRLRKLSEDAFRPELKAGCSMVRELHVYGSVVPVSSRDPTKFQHQVRCSSTLCLFHLYLQLVRLKILKRLISKN